VTLNQLITEASRVRDRIHGLGQDGGGAEVILVGVPLIARDISLVVLTPEPGLFALHAFNRKTELPRGTERRA
jgi:hypothetical protein